MKLGLSRILHSSFRELPSSIHAPFSPVSFVRGPSLGKSHLLLYPGRYLSWRTNTLSKSFPFPLLPLLSQQVVESHRVSTHVQTGILPRVLEQLSNSYTGQNRIQ